MAGLPKRAALVERVRQVRPDEWEAVALDVFRYQAAHNPVYAKYLQLLQLPQAEVRKLEDIPCLPIGLFKKYMLQTGDWAPERLFTSSGTTGAAISRHALRDPAWYRENALRGFAHFYGPVEDYAVLALLPAYLEREGSSLVFMADDFIHRSRFAESGFFLHDQERLLEVIRSLKARGSRILLLGVSFALLDLAEQYAPDLSGVIVMETGGMKGRRRELTRPELHAVLQQAFQVPAIHSEYGMTELLSQAYSQGEGLFRPAPTLRVLPREITDPFGHPAVGRIGALNLMDLANLDTISFIATEDLGRVFADGSFEVMGRLDNSDMRGCNLLVSEVVSLPAGRR